jgi:hypothetical protein
VAPVPPVTLTSGAPAAPFAPDAPPAPPAPPDAVVIGSVEKSALPEPAPPPPAPTRSGVEPTVGEAVPRNRNEAAPPPAPFWAYSGLVRPWCQPPASPPTPSPPGASLIPPGFVLADWLLVPPPPAPGPPMSTVYDSPGVTVVEPAASPPAPPCAPPPPKSFPGPPRAPVTANDAEHVPTGTCSTSASAVPLYQDHPVVSVAVDSTAPAGVRPWEATNVDPIRMPTPINGYRALFDRERRGSPCSTDMGPPRPRNGWSRADMFPVACGCVNRSGPGHDEEGGCRQTVGPRSPPTDAAERRGYRDRRAACETESDAR